MDTGEQDRALLEEIYEGRRRALVIPPETVTRRDPQRRMARFYALRIQGSLFDAWSLIREWGRIGSPGRVRVDQHATIAELAAAADRIAAAKRRKGYR
jgi:predicted DNA-binding WGR domain protein